MKARRYKSEPPKPEMVVDPCPKCGKSMSVSIEANLEMDVESESMKVKNSHLYKCRACGYSRRED